jgi:hypothetical protein
MQTERPQHPTRPARTTVAAAEVAKALGTAVLSLALGAAVCLALLLGGASLAAG